MANRNRSSEVEECSVGKVERGPPVKSHAQDARAAQSKPVLQRSNLSSARNHELRQSLGDLLTQSPSVESLWSMPDRDPLKTRLAFGIFP
jgi:hypothetical protein